MNIKNAKRLLRRLKQVKSERVWLGNWVSLRLLFKDRKGFLEHRNECGTTGCIAGHACMIMPPKEVVSVDSGYGVDFFTSAKNWLDITHDQASALFASRHDDCNPDDDQQTAIDRLTAFIAEHS